MVRALSCVGDGRGSSLLPSCVPSCVRTNRASRVNKPPLREARSKTPPFAKTVQDGAPAKADSPVSGARWTPPESRQRTSAAKGGFASLRQKRSLRKIHSGQAGRNDNEGSFSAGD